MSSRSWNVVLVILLLLGSCHAADIKRRGEITPKQSAAGPSSKASRPRGVILVIGDGMGPGPVSLLLHAKPEGGLASMMRSGVVGVVDVTPYEALVTDSAAGGTALSCGVQTRPRMVAMAPDGAAVETWVEAAKKANIATGVVTTSALTDATPATFLAHSVSRLDTQEIAAQIKSNPPTIAVGGGSGVLPEGDGFILHGAGDLPFAISKKRPSLSSMAQEALSVLEKTNGPYILMIEAAHIDKANHAHDAPALYAELLDLDALLSELTTIAAANDLLVVVTADHDTGGFGFNYRRVIDAERSSLPQKLPSGETWEPGADFGIEKDIEALARGETPPSVSWSTYTHTSLPVFVVAVGPGAELFGGLHAQWQLGKLLHQQLGLLE